MKRDIVVGSSPLNGNHFHIQTMKVSPKELLLLMIPAASIKYSARADKFLDTLSRTFPTLEICHRQFDIANYFRMDKNNLSDLTDLFIKPFTSGADCFNVYDSKWSFNDKFSLTSLASLILLSLSISKTLHT